MIRPASFVTLYHLTRHKIYQYLPDPRKISINRVHKATQIQLSLEYKRLLREGAPLPSFREVEFRAHSQAGEDGILLYIFSLIGTTNKVLVEMCAGHGIECNSANLLINHGWNGMLLDGNPGNVKKGNKFYRSCPDTVVWPPKFLCAWITKDNVNDLIRDNDIPSEIDLFSLDLDGMDYWIWDALEATRPRVLVAEYENSWGSERALTRPYQDDFSETHLLAGASLPALVKMGRKKGYRLIGCQTHCFNAFFMSEGVGEDIFPEVPVESCFDHPMPKWRQKHKQPEIMFNNWIEV